MSNLKIACLGSGSGYFRHALGQLAVTAGLAGSDVLLYDIDQEKNDLMARLGQRLSDQAGAGWRVRACARLAEAVDGADFVLSSIGGAGPTTGRVYATAAHRADILIPAKYGVFQIVGDTGGPAGMMMGLRSVPVHLAIGREVEKRAPRAVLINHANPMAILCRAMVKYSNVRCVIGICHGVQAGIAHVARILGVPPQELDTVWIGTNHYYWFTRICHRGRDVYPELRRRVAEMPPAPDHVFTTRLSQIYGFQITYPDDSHVLEFYPFLAQVRDAHHFPYHVPEHFAGQYDQPPETVPAPSEAQRQADRAAYLKAYADELDQVELPTNPLHPVTGESIGTLLEAIATGRRQVHIVNIPNHGCVPNLPAHAVLEVEAVTDSCGVRGVCMGEAPPTLAAILHKRIAWQELVVDAAVKADRRLALEALLLDEMAVRPELAEAMLDELLAANRDFLPSFR